MENNEIQNNIDDSVNLETGSPSENTTPVETKTEEAPVAEPVQTGAPSHSKGKQEVKAERNWYAVHTYSGYENAVLRNLKQRIESLGMEDKIFAVVLPTEKKVKVKGGKRVMVEEKIYPGYVLVDMIVTDDSWYVVRNTPRVTGFVGAGVKPVPLDKSEVDMLFKRMGAETPKHNIDLLVGELVKVSDGPFKDFEGKVSGIDSDRGKVKVMVSMFGRETSVELDFLQVAKV